jgi:hypothetical protein
LSLVEHQPGFEAVGNNITTAMDIKLDENSIPTLNNMDTDGKDKRTLKTKIEDARRALTEAKTNYERLKIEHENLKNKKGVTNMPEVHNYPSNATPVEAIQSIYDNVPVGAGYRVPHKPDTLQRNNSRGSGRIAADNIRSRSTRPGNGGSNLKRTRKKKVRN